MRACGYRCTSRSLAARLRTPCTARQTLVGSRCGPMDVALRLMAARPEVRSLLDGMTALQLPKRDAADAIERAAAKGVLKVQVVLDGGEDDRKGGGGGGGGGGSERQQAAAQ